MARPIKNLDSLSETLGEVIAQSVGLAPAELLEIQSEKLSEALFVFSEGGHGQFIVGCARSVVEEAFANAHGADASLRETARLAIRKSGFDSAEGIAIAIRVAMERGNAHALAGAAQLSPIKLSELVVRGSDEEWTVAALAVTMDKKRERPGEMLRAALLLGADLWAKDDNESDALDEAIVEDEVEIVRWILSQAKDAKAEAILQRPGIWSRCQRAVGVGAADVLRVLLGAGASCDERDHERGGETLLIDAAERGEVGCIEALLDFGADIDLADDDGETPLVRAAVRASLDAVNTLLSRGANPNRQNAKRESALSIAIAENSEAIVELLAPVTDPALRNARGESALEQAIAIAFWPGVDALSVQASETAAMEALAAFSRGKLPRMTRLAERGMLRAAAEAGEARRKNETVGTAAVAPEEEKEENGESGGASADAKRKPSGRRI
jgi:hypothetical protein